GEPVLRLVERGDPDLEARRAEAVADRAVDSVRIHRPDGLVGALLAILVPDGDAGHQPVAARAARSGATAGSSTTAPPCAAESRIASHSRAIRRPTSAGLGLAIVPARTFRN